MLTPASSRPAFPLQRILHFILSCWLVMLCSFCALSAALAFLVAPTLRKVHGSNTSPWPVGNHSTVTLGEQLGQDQLHCSRDHCEGIFASAFYIAAGQTICNQF